MTHQAHKLAVGTVFTRWTIINNDTPKVKNHSRSECRCACGTIAFVSNANLLNGHSKSCGCLMLELRSTTNGQAAFTILWRSYRTNAKRDNREFTLTKEQF